MKCLSLGLFKNAAAWPGNIHGGGVEIRWGGGYKHRPPLRGESSSQVQGCSSLSRTFDPLWHQDLYTVQQGAGLGLATILPWWRGMG